MNWNLIWIYILVLQVCYVSSLPVPEAASTYSEHVSGARGSTSEHVPGARSSTSEHVPGASSSTYEHISGARGSTTEHVPWARSSTSEHVPVARSSTFEHAPGARSSTSEHVPVVRSSTFEHAPGARSSTSEHVPGARSSTSEHAPGARSSTSEHFLGARSSANEHTDTHNDEKVISVRITSSVAVARGNSKPTRTDNEHNLPSKSVKKELAVKNMTEAMEKEEGQELPPNLRGANIEFLKQLHAKKEPDQFSSEQYFETSALRYDDEETMPESNNDQTNINKGDAITSKILSSDDFKGFRSKSLSILDEALKLADERLNPNITDEVAETKPSTENVYLSTFYEGEYSGEDKSGFNLSDSKESNETDDSLAESSIRSILEIAKQGEDFENVPLARSLHAQASKNYIQESRYKPQSERESSTRLTTISFNILHDAPKAPSYNEHKPYPNHPTHYQEHKFYETPTIYSEPAKIYSEPAKIYSEPSKVYSEPAKIYGEPAKVYSEPAKVYSEPAKFYSQPASLHLQPNPRNYPTPEQWQLPTTVRTTSTEPMQTAEENYEIDEKVSVLSDGRTHGVQESTTEKCKQDNCKVGYVVKGRQFNKYRVEERTSDGFIVGEYGVVRNEDGALRGVRYTADSEASPRLIYDALMKFLQLK